MGNCVSTEESYEEEQQRKRVDDMYRKAHGLEKEDKYRENPYSFQSIGTLTAPPAVFSSFYVMS